MNGDISCEKQCKINSDTGARPRKSILREPLQIPNLLRFPVPSLFLVGRIIGHVDLFNMAVVLLKPLAKLKPDRSIRGIAFCIFLSLDVSYSLAAAWLETVTSAPVNVRTELGYELEYPCSHRQYIERLAEAADRALADIRRTMAFCPVFEFRLIVMPDTYSFKEYAQVDYAGALVLCDTRNIMISPEYLRIASPERYYHTLKHELTHLCLCRMGLSGLPRWLDEGIVICYDKEHFLYNKHIFIENALPLKEMIRQVSDPYINYPKAASVVEFIVRSQYNGKIDSFVLALANNGRELVEYYSDPLLLDILDAEWRSYYISRVVLERCRFLIRIKGQVCLKVGKIKEAFGTPYKISKMKMCRIIGQ